MTRRWTGRAHVTAAALLAVTVIGPAVATGHEPRAHPRAIEVGSGGLYVHASLGSHCWFPREGAGACADAAYPIKVRGRLPVQPRDPITLHVPDHARRVRVALLRVAGDTIEQVGRRLKAHRGGAGPHRWRVRLPGDLRGANRLDVFVRYELGDADFWAGIAPRG